MKMDLITAKAEVQTQDGLHDDGCKHKDNDDGQTYAQTNQCTNDGQNKWMNKTMTINYVPFILYMWIYI